MRVKRILVDMPDNPAGRARLERLPDLAVEHVEPSEEARPIPEDIARDKHILFCTIPPTNVGGMVALELVQIASAGYSQLYGLDLAQRAIRACNALGVFDTAIAEWNIAMMVNLARDLRRMIRNQESGIFDRSARFQREVRGHTVGIWGYGGIGRETARLANNMGMVVHVMSRHGVGPRRNTYSLPGTGDPEGTLPDRVFLPRQEGEFLAGLDFLVLGMPLMPATEGIIGAERLRAMRPSSFLLNPARGPLVQEDALLRALREGWIAGAARRRLTVGHASRRAWMRAAGNHGRGR
jgi:phosphoglycerate dehydrogenase-like enzyme